MSDAVSTVAILSYVVFAVFVVFFIVACRAEDAYEDACRRFKDDYEQSS